MKNLKSILFLSIITLFFACKKEEITPERSTTVTVTYSILLRGEANMEEVRYLDENGQMQTFENPTADWTYVMEVEEGFRAKMELLGSLPPGSANMVMARIDGSGYGSWSSNFYQQVPGDFHIKNEYQMGGY